jgi:hypothetical protein
MTKTNIKKLIKSQRLKKGSVVSHVVVAKYADTDPDVDLKKYSFDDVEKYRFALMAISDAIFKQFGFLTRIRNNRIVIQTDTDAVDHEYHSFKNSEKRMRRRHKRYRKIDTKQLTMEMKRIKESRDNEMSMKLLYLKQYKEKP